MSGPGPKKPEEPGKPAPSGSRPAVQAAPRPPPDLSKAHAEDSYVGKTSISLGELKKVGEAAPEVSQGAWRERVFTPRAIMPREEIKLALGNSLRTGLAQGNSRSAMEAMRGVWFPVLRQALEQVGGDGMDSWLLTLLTPPGKPARQPFFGELAKALQTLREAKDLPSFEAEAKRIVEFVDAAFNPPPLQRPRLSFKQMEKLLEGKLEVDELLAIRCGPQDDLHKRFEEIGSTMSQLRAQIQKMPGKQPDGIYSNFVRLKAELRVIDAELRARGVTPAAPPPADL